MIARVPEEEYLSAQNVIMFPKPLIKRDGLSALFVWDSQEVKYVGVPQVRVVLEYIEQTIRVLEQPSVQLHPSTHTATAFPFLSITSAG
jgi:hypothetical protein